MRPSFSSQDKEQVLYTKAPPGRKERHPARRSDIWRTTASSKKSPGHCRKTDRFFRTVPMPVHGASTKTPSKQRGKRSPKSVPSAFSTIAFFTPATTRFARKARQRAAEASLATMSPLPPMSAAKWVVLPPGAAHKSNTAVCSRFLREGDFCKHPQSTSAGNIDVASWTKNSPRACSTTLPTAPWPESTKNPRDDHGTGERRHCRRFCKELVQVEIEVSIFRGFARIATRGGRRHASRNCLRSFGEGSSPCSSKWPQNSLQIGGAASCPSPTLARRSAGLLSKRRARAETDLRCAAVAAVAAARSARRQRPVVLASMHAQHVKGNQASQRTMAEMCGRERERKLMQAEA
mmetsp:Transcript_178271/g.571471  ORF Transcript_178271/g.571471 Transcript_178271/m.571471 type:complete len:349 (-) Transcript_178271:3-1049(-)